MATVYVFTGEEIVATQLVPKLNENFAILQGIENGGVKKVNNVAPTSGNVNVKNLIATQITSAVDLNNYKTAGEFYRTTNVTITHAPTTKNFFLSILVAGSIVKQLVTEIDTTDPLTFTRTFNGSVWSPWVEGGKVKTINNKKPDDAGNIDVKSLYLNKIAENTDLNTLTTEGRYACNISASAATMVNCPVREAFYLDVYANDNDRGDAAYAQRKQVLTLYSGNATMYVRNMYNPTSGSRTWNAWKQLTYAEDLGMWKPSEAVSVGQKRYLYGRGNTGFILECVKAGTTGTTQPVVSLSDVTGDRDIVKNMLFSLTNTELNHNSIYRGKNLGTVTADTIGNFLVLHGVSSGEFKDIFVGDYFTISGDTYNKVWVVVGIDSLLGVGDTALNAHHLVLMPKVPLLFAGINDTNTSAGGFKGSKMFTTILPQVNTNLEAVLGSHLLSRRALLTNSVDTNASSAGMPSWKGASDNWEWADCKAMLATEVQIYGSTVFSSSAYDVGEGSEQLPAFKFYHYTKVLDRNWFWLRAVAHSSGFCSASGNGSASANGASPAGGVRPLICVG